MKKDYQFLIGHRFSVGGELYVVRDLTCRDEHIYVRADLQPDDSSRADIVLSEPGQAGGHRVFGLNEVIQTLVVDEEIELAPPTYLAAR